MSFVRELKRRNVYKVGIAYVVVAWLVLQLSDVLLSMLALPLWVGRGVIFVLLVGFPLALVLAWAFEITPEGVKRDKDVVRSESTPRQTGRTIDFVIIGALVVAVGYFLWERQHIDESTALDRSVAVLPFVNLSSNEEQEWFADGLTEEILNSLARTPDLLVAARTSSFAYKGSSEDVRVIAEALGVAHILAGTVRRGGTTLRVTAQLVRARDGFNLWTETYDLTSDDVIAIQEDVATQIANALETAIDPEALAAMISSGTTSVPAYEAYLQGLASWSDATNSVDTDLFLQALATFETAVSLDPEFALAHGRIANFWGIQLLGNDMRSGLTNLTGAEMLDRYSLAAEKAIQYEKDPVKKLDYRAYKARIELNYRESYDLWKQYLHERPNDTIALGNFFNALRTLGLHQESAKIISTRQIRNELDIDITSQSLQSLRYSDDVEYLQSYIDLVLDRFSNSPNIQYQAHRALLWAGAIDRASEVLDLLRSSTFPRGNMFLAELRQACAETRVQDAEDLFAETMEKGLDRELLVWLSYKIIGMDQMADELLRGYDDKGELTRLSGYMHYGAFEPTKFPNLMVKLAGQGFESRKVYPLPYRCNR
jgi:TolB-like protein